MILKMFSFLCKKISTHTNATNKGMQSQNKLLGLNNLSKLEKTFYKLHLTKILLKRFFDHHPVTSKEDMKIYTILFVKN